MFKILYIVSCLSALDVVAHCEPTLVILRNMYGVEEAAPSILFTSRGKNFSVTCKTVDVKNTYYTGYDPVVWSKKINHKFQGKQEDRGINKLVNISDPSKLSFLPVTLDDDGTYLCTNTKYNLKANLHLIVLSFKPDKKAITENQLNSENQPSYGAVIGFFAGFGMLLLSGALLCIVNPRKRSIPRDVPANAIPLPYNSINSYINRNAETVNLNNRTPTPAVTPRHESDETTTVLTFLITPSNITLSSENRQSEDLDVPPSYYNCIRNLPDLPATPPIDTYDLPPSYNEAIANFANHTFAISKEVNS